MTSIDRILDILDNAGQTSTEHGYGVGFQDASTCWRCHGTPGDGPSGMCDGCRDILLAEVEASEPVAPATSLETSPYAYIDAWQRLAALPQRWMTGIELADGTPCQCNLCQYYRAGPQPLNEPTSAEAFRAATCERDADLARRQAAIGAPIADAISEMQQSMLAYGVAYTFVAGETVFGFDGADPEERPVALTRSSFVVTNPRVTFNGQQIDGIESAVISYGDGGADTYWTVPVVPFTQSEPAPIVSRRTSGRMAPRRRTQAPPAARCHHGNPRNACRDCSMGRR